MTQEQLEELTRLRERTRILEDAIRRHRDASGHERCWLNDVALYNALGEGVPSSPSLPERSDFLRRCAQYHSEQTGEPLFTDATSVVPQVPAGHALLVEVDESKLPMEFDEDATTHAQQLALVLEQVKRVFLRAKSGDVVAHASAIRVVGTCVVAERVEVVVKSEHDSPVCNCQFPTVVARNMHGHANDCPVFLDWYEKTFSRPFPFIKETRHEQKEASTLAPRTRAAIADAEESFASKLEEGES